ncbi:prophage tail fiber N-terminal domain-containing protein [Vibrio fluvialis]|nr:prophage tail fiber N-terminal domain-containing protein [Vibrio fluvialis]MBY7979307.1 prophage tail fiber N-terminal domain-containing protein [Vibrio fluvialis]
MPSVQVTGVLESPSTVVEANAEIKIVSQLDYGRTTRYSQSDPIFTDASGNYDFQLVYGKHLIAIKYDGSSVFSNLGTVSVSDELPATIDLITLLATSSTDPDPVLVTQLQQIAAEAAQSASEASESASEAQGYEASAAQSASQASSSASNSLLYSQNAQSSASAAESAKDIVVAAEQNIESIEQNVVSLAAQTALDAQATAADRVATNADAAQTALDAQATAADRVATASDAAQTALDAQATAADRVATNADAAQTALDAQSTSDSASAALASEQSAAASAFSASDDANTANVKAGEASLSAYNALQSENNAAAHEVGAGDYALLSQRFANEAVDTEVEPGLFSAKHYAVKAEQSASQILVYGGEWTPTAGTEYPTPTYADRDEQWYISFPDPIDNYVFTTGDLAGRTAFSSYILTFKYPELVFALIATPSGAGILEVNGKTGSSVEIGSNDIPHLDPDTSPTTVGAEMRAHHLDIQANANAITALQSSKMDKSGNLSDLQSVSTARTNLDVYSKSEVDASLLEKVDKSTTVAGKPLDSDIVLYQSDLTPASQSITYNVDGTINTVTDNGVVTTFSYNPDGTINTTSTPTHVSTYAYTSGVLDSITVSEV